MYVIGEQGLGGGIERPDLASIYLGCLPLDGLYETSTRFTGIAIQTPTAGSRRRIWPMAPEQHRMRVIPRPMMTSLCPSGIATNDTAFSQSYSPSSNATLGYRTVNGQLSDQLRASPSSMSKMRILIRERTVEFFARRRVKVSGNRKDDNDYGPSEKDRGQVGVGREYGRMMGLQFLNGQIIQADRVEKRG